MKTNRVEIARDTLAILEAGYYLNNKNEVVDVGEAQEFTMEHTKLFTPGELEELARKQTEPRFTTVFEVENETTLDAARRVVAEGEQDPLCLNFASAKNPGGGFLGGAVPKVPVFKDEEGNRLDEIVCTSIITSPAANAGAIANNERSSLDKILPVMQLRIDKLLALCRHYNHETLVLGAWGCGVFRNEPEDIARLFHEALTGKYKGQFKRVVFAVNTNKESIIEPFRKWFAN